MYRIKFPRDKGTNLGAVVGYARVSSRDQDFASQVSRLEDAGAEKLFTEKRSGLDGTRPALRECLSYLREGDTLLITKLDRLARSTADLYKIVSDLDKRNITFKVLDDTAIDTSSRTGKLVMGILALIAEFETDIRRERQMEGIAKAKAEGRTGGRPRMLDDEMIQKIRLLRQQGTSLRSIAKISNVSLASVQRCLTA